MVVVALWTEGKFGQWVLRDERGVIIWHGVINGDGSRVQVSRRGMIIGLWCIKVEPTFSIFIGLEIGVAGLIVIGHGIVGLAIKGAVGFTAEVGVFQRMGAGLGAVGSGTGGEDCIIALAYKALIEEGGK
jgi:hypothetical protein